MGHASILIKDKTKSGLDKLKKQGESYNTVIEKLLLNSKMEGKNEFI